jgi:eukaryotic-like serine/threonine-protein kinase
MRSPPRGRWQAVAAPGHVFAGRYRLDDLIATGGVGEVWRGTDLALDRRVAVKLLRPEHAEDEEGLARFRAEAHHAGLLSHPNIAHVYDFDATAPGYLVMELVRGSSLARMLDGGPLSPQRTLDIVAQAARGLAAAHQAGLVHRDVKPGNLLMGADGLVKITDFGIAQSAGMAPVTRTGTLIGTPAYLAPERGAGLSATPAADLYSLGVVAFQCLTGRVPFRGEPLAVVIAHIERPLPPLPPDVPPAVAALVAELTSKDPQDRPATAAEVALAASYLQDKLAADGQPAPRRMPAGRSPASRVPAAPFAAGPPLAATRMPAPAPYAAPAIGPQATSPLEIGALEAGALEAGALGADALGVDELEAGPLGVDELGAGPLGADELEAGPLGMAPALAAAWPPLTGLPTRAALALSAVGAAGLLGWTMLTPGAGSAAHHVLSRPAATQPATPRGHLARRPGTAQPARAAAPASAMVQVRRPAPAHRRRARPGGPASPAPTPGGEASVAPSAPPSATPDPGTPGPGPSGGSPSSSASPVPTPSSSVPPSDGSAGSLSSLG